MQRLLTAILLLLCAGAHAQTPPKPDLKALFEATQSLGTEAELRSDISDRLGFGDHPLAIKDLVITKDGVQHAVNAFIVGDKGYLLFNSHLRVPEVYLFVMGLDGVLESGIHGPQFQPITSTVKMTSADAPVVDEEEAFWRQWIADGAQVPLP